jgi:protein ImuB
MVRRFGKDAALRLEQALGHTFEPIDPLIPEETPRSTLAYAPPIGKLETL